MSSAVGSVASAVAIANKQDYSYQRPPSPQIIRPSDPPPSFGPMPKMDLPNLSWRPTDWWVMHKM